MKSVNALPISLVICIALVFGFAIPAFAQQMQQPVSQLPMQQTSLVFTENNGQVADLAGNLRPDILFTTYAPGVKLFITAKGIHYQFIHTQRKYPEGVSKHDLLRNQEFNEDSGITNIHRVAMEFVNANSNPQIIKELETPYVENFYLGHCQQGVLNVKTYEKITVKNLYPGIDWVLYTYNNGLKYDLIVHPGADPSVIKIKYTGQDSLQLNTAGQLDIYSSLGTIEENAPVILQGRKKIAGKFKLSGDIVSFNISNYNKSLPLIIDPEIIWGTYYGDAGYTTMHDVTINKDNFVYLCGETESATGVAYNGYKNALAGGTFPDDAFIVKFDKNGNRIWGTYFGGDYGEKDNRIVLDDSSNIYLAFRTRSSITLKGTVNKINHSNPASYDAYLAKFNSNGVFIWGTFFGGTETELVLDIKCDRYQDVYFCGRTESFSGIAKNGYINAHSPGVANGFVVKFDRNGTHLWSTYYGRFATGCAIDNENNLIISGACDSATPQIYYNGFKSSYSGGGSDAFIAKLDSAGNVIWSTFYGGAGNDGGQSCASDKQGNCYLIGNTSSKTSISYNGYQNNMLDKYYYSSDAFITKFDKAGNRLWSTYIGGDSGESLTHGAINMNGEIYITGYTQSRNYPLKNEIKPSVNASDPWDGFITKLSPLGNLMWSTYLGTDNYDYGFRIKPDFSGNFYLIESSTLNNVPYVINGFKTTVTSTVGNTYYLLKFRDVKFYIEDITTPAKICAGDNIKIKYTTQNPVNTGNIFTFQVSDSVGNFTNPITIGTKVSTSTGTDSITLAIPYTVPPGNKYSFRVISSNIADTTYGFGEFKIENPKVKINFSGPQASCSGDSVELTAPVYPGYTYFWQKDGSTIPGAIQPFYKATQLGSYYLTTFTPSGCWAYSDTLNVTAGTTLNAGFSGDTIICNNSKINFSDTSKISSGNYKRLWKPSFSDTTSALLFSTGNPVIGPHTITLVITSDAGCKDSITKSVIINAAPSAALITDKDTLLCPGDSIILSVVTENGNTISWLKNNSQLSATDTFLMTKDSGKYLAISKSPNNCTDTAAVTVNLIQIPQKGFIEVKKNGKPVILPLLCVEDDEYLDLNSSLPGNLLWLPANSSTTVLSAYDTGWVHLELTPNSGCKLKDSVFIGDGCSYTLFIPNAFTPNKKDSLNSTFKATGTNIIEFRIEIFSIWGERLFEADNINTGWDGTYKGIDCTAGIYFYQVVYKGRRSNGHTYKSSTKGTITLIR